MERHEARGNETIEELISSAERGVEVELTRDGRVVARVIPASVPKPAPEPPQSDWRSALQELHAKLPPNWPRTGWTEVLREARDESPI